MNPTQIIEKKRDGKILSAEEIEFFIKGVSTNSIPDYQISAFLMAVYFRGFQLNETVALTRAMLDSGERYDLSSTPGYRVDKHSTGGVGDKVSIILAPLAASCGVKVPMMSGRGLGFSGGTLDKLESIPGFQVSLSRDEFQKVLGDVGCAMIGQSERIAPADKKLYAIRDVTGTVESIPLIVSSILSKKIAEGTQGLVLDVKVGSGAFMKTRKEASLLAQTLKKVGTELGLNIRYFLTSMDQPLGSRVGNSLEIMECIDVLRSRNCSETHSGHCDLKELTLQLCTQMILLAGLQTATTKARKLAQDNLASGRAWEVFKKLVAAQGGNLDAVEDPTKLPLAPKITVWKSPKKGFLVAMDTARIGQLLIELGGGRKKVTDSIDRGVGFVFHKKLGSNVKVGEPLVSVYHCPETNLEPLEKLFFESLGFSATRKSVPKLILDLKDK